MNVGFALPLLIKVTTLLAFALFVDTWLRRRSVLWLSAFWNAVLVAIVVLPVAPRLIPQWTLPLLPAESRLDARQVRSEPPVEMPTFQPSVDSNAADLPRPRAQSGSTPRGNEIGILIASIYVLGVIVLLVRLIAGWHAVRDVRRRAFLVTEGRWRDRWDFWTTRLAHPEKAPDASAGAAAGAFSDFSSKTKARLWKSDRIGVPTAFGIRQPQVVIPTRIVDDSTASAIDAILVHELAHVYRGDCGWQLLQRIAEALLWFHPLIWMAKSRIDFVRERACDDFAVRMTGDDFRYGEVLLDIAEGIVRRRMLSQGLAIVRSSALEQRLSAIAASGGSNRFVAPRGARWATTTGVVVAVLILGCLVLGRARAQGTSAPAPRPEPSSTVAAESLGDDENPRRAKPPELVAVSWQQHREASGKRIEQPVWRPDGTRLSDAEVKMLLDDVKSFEVHWWNETDNLRPLVFVLRTEMKKGGGFSTAVVLPDNKRSWPGTYMYPLANGLAMSSSSPMRLDLEKWPEKIDLDVKVPQEASAIVKTIDAPPDVTVDVGPGVRWYIDHERGADFSNRDAPTYGFKAAVLEVRNEHMESRTKYASRIWLDDDRELDSVGYVTVIEREPGVLSTIYVSAKIDDVKAIKRVEFTRQRFRMERINGVATRLDLMPKD